MAARSPWLDRIGGAALGAGVTAVVLWPTTDAVVSPDLAPPAVAPVAATIEDRPAPADGPTLAQSMPSEPAPRARAPAPDMDNVQIAEPAEPETADAQAQDSAEPEVAPVPPPGDAPEIPLSRLPGTRTLHRASRFDTELDAWVVTHTLQVPAPASQVESFYRKALEAEGHDVRLAMEPADDRYAVRVTLRGRASGRRATISIRQPATEMRTTARIIWQKMR